MRPRRRRPEPARHVQETLSDLGHAHGAGDAEDLTGAIVNAADTAPGIGLEHDFIARASLGFVGDPGGSAPGPIA